MKRFVKEHWYLMILKLGRVGGSTKHLKINVTVASTASTSLGGGDISRAVPIKMQYFRR